MQVSMAPGQPTTSPPAVPPSSFWRRWAALPWDTLHPAVPPAPHPGQLPRPEPRYPASLPGPSVHPPDGGGLQGLAHPRAPAGDHPHQVGPQGAPVPGRPASSALLMSHRILLLRTSCQVLPKRAQSTACLRATSSARSSPSFGSETQWWVWWTLGPASSWRTRPSGPS